jgi:hypothetical protein
MKPTLRRYYTAGACALAFCLSAIAMPTVAADKWLKAESDNFVIYSNASEKTTRAYVKDLEVFRRLTSLLLGSPDTASRVKFDIVLLDNPDQMLQVRPTFSKHVAGVYFSCGEGLSAYSALQNGEMLGDQDPSLVTLFHEYSHYIMFQHAKSYYPAWYVEGFADFLATAYPDKGKITVGEPSTMRTWTLAEDRWISFEKILKPTFGFAGDRSNDEWEVSSFYAQSWLLTHYMLSDSTRAKSLNAYFADVGKGADPVASFETHTGIKVRDLAGILKRYRDKIFYLTVPVPEYADGNIRTTTLPPETDSYMLQRSLLTTCMPPEQGKAVLAQLAAKKPQLSGNIDYRLALVRAHLLYGKVADAEAEIGPLVDAHPENAEVNYLMGRTYYLMAQSAKGQDRNDLIDAARGFFLAAYDINKLNSPNLYYLARSFENQPGFPDQNALNAAKGAHVLAPGVPDYAVFAAFASLSNGKRDDAVALLTPFVSNPHDRAQAERFQKTIDAIKAGRPTHEAMRHLE